MPLPLSSRAAPDVIVNDIRMPGADGYSLLRKVREMPEERGGHIPAGGISASIGEEEVPRIYDVGFQLFVRKGTS